MFNFCRSFQKITSLFILPLVLSFAFVACSQSPDRSQFDQSPRAEEIRQAGKLIVGTASPYEPAVFKDTQSGKYVGFDVEIAEAIAARIGVPIEWKDTGAFKDLLPSLQRGEMDLAIASISITPERQTVLDFSDSYAQEGIVLLAETRNRNVITIKDIKDKVIGVTRGTVSDDTLKQLATEGLSFSKKEYDREREMIAELKLGKTDAVLNGSVNSAAVLKIAPDLKVVGEPLNRDKMGIAVKKGDTGLLTIVNDVLQELHTSKRLDALLDKWLGSARIKTAP